MQKFIIVSYFTTPCLFLHCLASLIGMYACMDLWMDGWMHWLPVVVPFLFFAKLTYANFNLTLPYSYLVLPGVALSSLVLPSCPKSTLYSATHSASYSTVVACSATASRRHHPHPGTTNYEAARPAAAPHSTSQTQPTAQPPLPAYLSTNTPTPAARCHPPTPTRVRNGWSSTREPA